MRNGAEPGARGAPAQETTLSLPGLAPPELTEAAVASPPQPALEDETPVRFAEVALFVPLGRYYSFSIPAELVAGAVTGARVICGLRGRRILGVILAVREGDPGIARNKLKPILAVVDAEPVVPGELLGFLAELASYYLAPIGEVLRLAVPAVERSRARALKQDGLSPTGLSAVGRSLSYVTALSPDPAELEALEAQLRGQARDVWEYLREQQSARLPDLLERWGNARAAVKKLEALGLVQTAQRSEVDGQFFSGAIARDVPPQLNEAQAQAVAAIEAQITAGNKHAFLLHGVTASGKTEVYLRAVQAALDRGGSALILVPEIALTPQLVGRFRARLGDTIAVLHSGLSQSQRHAMWTLLYTGERRVAVGARSALFAPLRDLRLICVDEEQDHSFKQEEGVRYNARDMALLRAQRAGAVCVLGSATPSIKSFHALATQKLSRLRLPERAHRTAALPRAEIVDLRRIGPGRPGERLLSLPLCRALEQVLERKEQAILFLNRRGFAPSVVCETCGEILGCPSCEVPLTYHVNPRPHVICHYCDYRDPVPERCAKCKADTLSFEGVGTERIESVLSAAFPSARVGRLDRDTGPGLKSAKVLAQMQAGELDILVGTQMVTKGHDLPRVSLVGVLNADAGLSMPDYQASERTFQILVQVAGRAGRAGTPGNVLIQTKNPEHPAIALAVTHDVSGFVEQELADRRALGYPPFSRLAMVRVSALDEQVARTAIRELTEIARQRAGTLVEVLGPSPAPIARLRSQYRFRLLVRAKTRAPLRHVLIGIQEARLDRRVRMVVDVDPVSML